MGRRSCPRTGKVRFFDHKDAIKALHVIMGKPDHESDKRRERRSYECPFCKGWHLTSQPHKEGLVDPVQLVTAPGVPSSDNLRYEDSMGQCRESEPGAP